MKKFPMGFSRLLGHLNRQSQKQKYQEECPERGIHLQKLARDATIMLQVCTLTWAASPSLSMQHGDRQGVVNRSPAEIQT